LPPDVRFQGNYAPNSISAGAPPQTALGELTALPQTPTYKGRGKRRGREGKGEGMKKVEGKEEGGESVGVSWICL